MDGVVNAGDALSALKIAAGLTNSTDPTVSFPAANVRASGKIGIAVAVTIIRMVNGKSQPALSNAADGRRGYSGRPS